MSYVNKDAKRYMIWAAIAAVIISAGAAVLFSFFTSSARQAENNAVYGLLTEILDQYPEADIQPLIESLNSSGSISDEVLAVLKTYGIDESRFAVNEMNTVSTYMIIGAAVIALIAAAVMIFIYLRYLKKRKQSLDILNGYIERLSMGEYSLDLADNSEDELSNLKNNLYKLMVMLKESAENANSNKRALAESVSDLSHQLKTPLTSATILLDNLKDNPDMDAEKRKKFIAEVSRQVNSMKWMVVSMLKLSRLDAGVIEFEEKEFNVSDMIEDSIESLNVLSELKDINVSCTVDESVMLKGDLKWSREAFTNILKNALEHSGVGSTVKIEVEDNDVYTALSVANVGEPFTREQEKNMFRRYYSGAREISDNENAGLGLPLAKAIVERQNGYLTATSEKGWNIFTMKFLKCY